MEEIDEMIENSDVDVNSNVDVDVDVNEDLERINPPPSPTLTDVPTRDNFVSEELLLEFIGEASLLSAISLFAQQLKKFPIEVNIVEQNWNSGNLEKLKLIFY